MQTVVSEDGTGFADERVGSGPPMVLLHGGSTTRRTWDAIRPHQGDDSRTSSPDRRGRGDCGDGEEYGLDREVADLRALVDAFLPAATRPSNPRLQPLHNKGWCRGITERNRQ
ncbi:alpha/beta fold hydrolase [Halomicrococcus gelatinilyticus]|uniref:alpha/beta fold hydrolase n=1 Tax=Halomicrococcus gelatinilyticus TaxID=1702103 RepID=UPI002E11B9F0